MYAPAVAVLAVLVCGASVRVSPVAAAADITAKVLGTDVHVLPAAFGDYNNDKQTDLFLLDIGREAVHVLLMDHSLVPMARRSDLKCTFAGSRIVSVVPSDFDGDGVLDILVVIRGEWSAATAAAGGGREEEEETVTEDDGLMTALLLWGDLTALHCAPGAWVQMRGQPLAVDMDGDMATDLVARSHDSDTLAVWRFVGRKAVIAGVLLNGTEAKHVRPDLGVFADVTGDLSADLVLLERHQQTVQVWTHTGDRWWQLLQKRRLPRGVKHVGQLCVLDLQSAGQLQLLVPVCFDDGCANSSLLVWLASGWVPVLLEVEDSLEGAWGFPAPQPGSVYGATIVARVGDYNLDGYPDLLMSLSRKQQQQQQPAQSVRSFLLKNVPCVARHSVMCAVNRAFSAQWATFADLTDSPAAAFYDVGDDGLLDVLVVRRVADDATAGASAHYTVSVQANSPDYDALFLKITVIDGGCYYNCSHGVRVPYGTNRPGPAARGQLTLADGSARSFAVAQLSQSAHHALQLPYSVFGLGRSPNFVDHLTVGVPRIGGSRSGGSSSGSVLQQTKKEEEEVPEAAASAPLTHSWTQLIPNSQLIVVPFPPGEPHRWLAKLYVTPGETIISTLGALLGTLAVTVLVVVALHWQERRQDRLERMQEAHRFNFDAM